MSLNFAMETKAKKLNCLSSYKGLNRFSLGQISELLQLTKESYCNVKLKCPDTGQYTVQDFARCVTESFTLWYHETDYSLYDVCPTETSLVAH